MAYAVVIPGQFAETHPPSEVYVRRRLMAILSLVAIVLVLFFGAGQVVANRGGAPASASMIRPAISNIYIVKAGDTLWSIGERYHGEASLVDYVDALVTANGGTELQVSQALTLP